MNLVIDIGNTASKFYLFDNGQLVRHEQEFGHELRLLGKIGEKAEAAIISSVVALPAEAEVRLQTLPCPAIRSGVIEGMRHEIEGYIDHFREKNPSLLVFLTGGDLNHFANTIKSPIFADQILVPRGLNHILDYNIRR